MGGEAGGRPGAGWDPGWAAEAQWQRCPATALVWCTHRLQAARALPGPQMHLVYLGCVGRGDASQLGRLKC